VKKPSTSLKRKSIPKSKHGNKVDLMIKFNPSDVFEVCSACNKDMTLEYQRPFSIFGHNGTDPICRNCGKKFAPEYIKILDSFYYSCGFPDEPFEPLEDLKSKESERIRSLKRLARDRLIKAIISKGFTEEQLETITSIPYKRHSCSEDDLPF